jgi:hypothetical protein
LGIVSANDLEAQKCLSATAIATMDGQSFAEALERAIERSKQRVPLLNGPSDPLPASELKKPMANFRRF